MKRNPIVQCLAALIVAVCLLLSADIPVFASCIDIKSLEPEMKVQPKMTQEGRYLDSHYYASPDARNDSSSKYYYYDISSNSNDPKQRVIFYFYITEMFYKEDGTLIAYGIIENPGKSEIKVNISSIRLIGVRSNGEEAVLTNGIADQQAFYTIAPHKSEEYIISFSPDENYKVNLNEIQYLTYRESQDYTYSYWK